ncbi:MAG: type-F conjugative transfer system secretin TraK [Pseudomonadota bacterium]|nr:type-F conjugative transfer system secretin TraK [Pseudomonadota bacterium]
MRRKGMWLLAVAGMLMSGAGLGQASAEGAVALPVVPVSVVRPGSDAVSAPKTGTLGNAPRVLHMVPGVNEIVPISLGHTNRLVTPFVNPDVHTTVSDAAIDVQHNIVYIATDKTLPVTMYITPHKDESVALSLTLAPRKIPPVQIELKMDAGYGATPGSETARRWEESKPYIESIRDVMRGIALGEIPQGYVFRETGAKDILPNCAQPAVGYDFENGQVLEGYNFVVFVGTATNRGGSNVEIEERQCATRSTAAVAVWPAYVLGPGQSTEIYVVRRRGETTRRPRSSRPSLVSANRW